MWGLGESQGSTSPDPCQPGTSLGLSFFVGLSLLQLTTPLHPSDKTL